MTKVKKHLGETMNMKNVLTLFGVLLLGMGLVFAISGAATSGETDLARWTGATAGNATTEGGNITDVDVDADSLTDRWGAFFGNVSGYLSLTDGAGVNDVYNWTWAAASQGEVCVSTDQAFDWANVEDSDAADVVAMNTAFGLGAAVDNTTGTFSTNNCGLTFDQGAVANTANVTHMGLSSFETCAVDDSVTGTEGGFAFCTNIDATGTNYNGTTANYEIMVPTTPGAGNAETYYFFAELA